ncbi:MAG: L-serine ammonia-lyase, iron-sulfur-dependent, subunit alpha [Holophagaceae bacterium]|nr:L-serine ammonia-lyase, iron-sulfur-dependent, subunit alpha [Holophagaceae bacterium]
MFQESTTFQMFLEQANDWQVPLHNVFLDYEVTVSKRPRKVLWEMMRSRIDVMQTSINEGLSKPQNSRSGLIRGDANLMQGWIDSGHSLLDPLFSKIIASALAVAEVNACMGRIVAAPTAGSCGVLPSVLITLAHHKKINEDELIGAFFTAGGIGIVIEQRASLSGAAGGCQAEVGSASAMAAGGLVEMLGGSPDQVGHAISFALTNVMGLICDPVLGLVEVPCAKRNVLGAVNAVACAEMALSGQKSIFSADAIIETMGKVGRKLPEEFRETAKGGIATIPLPDKF